MATNTSACFQVYPNQHEFCTHVDRVQPTVTQNANTATRNWEETVLARILWVPLAIRRRLFCGEPAGIVANWSLF
jgi:hypothetical protein